MTMKICIICNCNKIEYVKTQQCRSCYNKTRRLRIQGYCKADGCNNKIIYPKFGVCDKHVEQNRITRPIHCSIDGCDRPFFAKTYCSSHYNQVRDNGHITQIVLPTYKQRRFKKDTGTYTVSNGYTRIRVPGRGYLLEHRYVMEQQLGRPLYPDENVHHLDGVKANNQPENLELWVKPQPSGITVEDAIAWAKEILRRYVS